MDDRGRDRKPLLGIAFGLTLVAGWLLSAAGLEGANRAPAQSEATPFDYDARTPLEVQVAGSEQRAGVTLQDITYASPKGGRVTAYLLIPEAGKKLAGIVYQHWGFGDRREFLSEALQMAQAGAACLLVDAPWARPQPWRREGQGSISMPQKEIELYVQTVVDLRRGIDLLIQHVKVDPKRIGYVGHSFGATWGGALAGVEHRIKAYVLMAGLPTLVDLEDRDAPAIAEMFEMMQERFTPEQIENYVKALTPIMPEQFVGRSTPAAIFFQWADHDVYISERAARRFFAAANEPKSERTYFCSHELNDSQATQDRARWLERQLGLAPAGRS